MCHAEISRILTSFLIDMYNMLFGMCNKAFIPCMPHQPPEIMFVFEIYNQFN